MKKTGKTVVVLFGICAVIWSLRAVLDIIAKAYQDSVFMFVLNMLCAVIWIIAFILCLKRYRAGKSE